MPDLGPYASPQVTFSKVGASKSGTLFLLVLRDIGDYRTYRQFMSKKVGEGGRENR
jgi:hypothetical protein